MKFRPCIDLHDGKVKQIVGGTLSDYTGEAKENFVSSKSSAEYASLYKKNQLIGGHVIMLGQGNDQAALSALNAYPGGLQVGGGITLETGARYLDAGASQIIVTSALFKNGQFSQKSLDSFVNSFGVESLVLDLSCRKKGDDFFVVSNRWQTFTELKLTEETLNTLADSCCEFLVHGVDVEGLQSGIEEDLIEILAKHRKRKIVYAGGIRSFSDMDRISEVGGDRIDFTVGSALDIFGGDVSFDEVVKRYS